MRSYASYLRRAYEPRHRTAVVRFVNRIGTVLFGAGIGPRRAAALEVVGRSTGRVVSLPVVVTDWKGGRYLVRCSVIVRTGFATFGLRTVARYFDTTHARPSN